MDHQQEMSYGELNGCVIEIQDGALEEVRISSVICGIYRVAQNKILHQTICNILATSGQILKILEAV